MFNHGVIVDITHCSEESRRDIFELRDKYAKTQPIVATHIGVRATSDYPLNLSDDDIRAIRNTGGVVGVISYPHWLKHKGEKSPGPEVDLVFRAIDHVCQIAGEDHVAIGTDLDGFIDPIDECRNYFEIGRFQELIVHRYGTDPGPEFVKKLLNGNVLRVLKQAKT